MINDQIDFDIRQNSETVNLIDTLGKGQKQADESKL